MRKPVEVDIENEKEWRRYQHSMLEDINKRVINLEVTVTTLKVKIGIFVASGSLLGSIAITFIMKKIGLS